MIFLALEHVENVFLLFKALDLLSLQTALARFESRNSAYYLQLRNQPLLAKFTYSNVEHNAVRPIISLSRFVTTGGTYTILGFMKHFRHFQ